MKFKIFAKLLFYAVLTFILTILLNSLIYTSLVYTFGELITESTFRRLAASIQEEALRGVFGAFFLTKAINNNTTKCWHISFMAFVISCLFTYFEKQGAIDYLFANTATHSFNAEVIFSIFSHFTIHFFLGFLSIKFVLERKWLFFGLICLIHSIVNFLILHYLYSEFLVFGLNYSSLIKITFSLILFLICIRILFSKPQNKS